MSRKRIAALPLAALAVATGSVLASGSAFAGPTHSRPQQISDGTTTPIQHVVVIFQENVSFDHYFGTYPNAANADGQQFTAAPGTPAVDGLLPATSPSIPAGLQHTTNLLTSNPNKDATNSVANPARLDSSLAGQLTCDQDHNYSDEE